MVLILDYGAFIYLSWDDFKNNATPVAFAITHSNRDDLKQVYPSFQYMQASIYVQDELNISDYFKLTAGLRIELPIYPAIAGNENKEYLELAKEGGYKPLWHLHCGHAQDISAAEHRFRICL
ncbi:MAG: TonB-dependent receptor [Clostridium sp.]|nr:TonB-dependent receptor [Bacteroides sp.]MCM1198496.1 TonB-dependent receptor [Clostridium sp.]